MDVELSRRIANAMVEIVYDAVQRRDRCSVALAGGNTPRTLYGLLASEFRDRLPWTRIHIFWGDERYVPADSVDSNYRMAREVLLDHVPCPPANIHPMPTYSASPDAAAATYAATLRDYFGDDGPRFDLALLGLGADGHTASLFPKSAALAERTRWVVATTAPAEPSVRLTLTLPVLNRAANLFVLVAGADKANALQHVRSGTADPNIYPAAGLQPTDGQLLWWVARVP
jgi:6-phosphogluconolactonase